MNKKFKWSIEDGEGRILVARKTNEKLVFFRYVDMKDCEKKMLISLYAFANHIDDSDIDNPDIKEMVDFLNFEGDSKENELCG
jgi:hypothetical protein